MSQEKRKLLVVDDDSGIQRQLRWSFEGYDVEVAGDREEALTRFRHELPPVCTVDLGLPPDPDSPTEGFRIVEEMLRIAPETKIIVVTGQDDHEHALSAIAMGAPSTSPHHIPMRVARGKRTARPVPC